ncbi:MAG TPA: basic amino acid ABC transporter substrate-binding protein [Spirochaetes bacterium]|nr:basic amino acid ABC transporter substrate-binding protein [Spirochaetota bacterium]
MLKRIIFCFILLFAASGVVFAGSPDEGDGGLHIVVATDATWPPMEYVDSDKDIVGFDIDLMKEIAKGGGFTFEFKNTAWDGIFAGLAGGKYDAIMSSVTITEERKQQMDFSQSYINAGQILVVQKSTSGVTVLADLKGKIVAAQIGTTGSFEIEKVSGVELKTYDEIGLAYEDLVNGRIDGVVADTPVAADFALQSESYKDKLKIVGEPFTEEFYGIAVQKGNKEVLDAINKGLDKVLGTSTYAKIEKKWLR